MGMKVTETTGEQSDGAAYIIDCGSRAAECYRWMLVIDGTATTFTIQAQILGGHDLNYYTLANGTAVAASGAPYLFEGWVGRVKITPSDSTAYTATLVGGTDGAR